MIERVNEYAFAIYCDGCNKWQEFECESFDEFMEESRLSGWLSFKDDGWVHYCRDCAERYKNDL